MDEAPSSAQTPLPLPPPPSSAAATSTLDGFPRASLEPTINTSGGRALRPGELMPGWRVAMISAWVGIIVGLLAVWRSSWTMGLSTWWLGPQAASRSWLIIAIPFVAPVVMVTLASISVRNLWAYGIGAALITSYVAWGDVGRVNGYALVEFVLAGAGLLISIASYGGMARRAG